MQKQVPIFSSGQIRKAISLKDAIDPVSRAFVAISGGTVQSPVYILHPTSYSDMHVKSAVVPGLDTYSIKVAGWSDKNKEKELPSSNGMVMIFDSESCRLRAILQDEHYLSDIRTAAAGALAARTLAPINVKSVGVIGAGEQAFLQLQALAMERDFHAVNIWSRTLSRAEGLASRIAVWQPGIKVQILPSPEPVVRRSDVVITATASKQPIVQGNWLRPGQHITAIGADDGTKVELDHICMDVADKVVVDSLEQAYRFGDVRAASGADSVRASRLVDCEIGDILEGNCPGRQNEKQITIATFVGLGVQDLMVAKEAMRRLEGL